jgi:hypothetical protein
MHGDFLPGRVDAGMREFLAFLVKEDAGEPSFDAELLDEESWWLVDARGIKHGISLPAVHWDKRTISWRWR